MEVTTLGDDFDAGSDAFLDTAAVAMHLDLVITSDTAIAHLAGALGRPVWVALRHVPDWRWMLDRDDLPWYPTARLFRQRRPGDWDDVAERMAAALARLSRAKADRAIGASPLATAAAAANLTANFAGIRMSVFGEGRMICMRTLAPAACWRLPRAAADGADKLVDEFKIGGLAHDVTFGGRHVESGADVNIEMLFTPPDILRFIGSPRPHIGGDINTSGNTSQGYFGLTWGIMLIQSLFGAGDGVLRQRQSRRRDPRRLHRHRAARPQAPRLAHPVPRKRRARLSADPEISVSAIVDHISNANLGNHNAGITSAGARLGVKF